MKTLMALLAVSVVLLVSVRAQAAMDEPQVNQAASIFYLNEDDNDQVLALKDILRWESEDTDTFED